MGTSATVANTEIGDTMPKWKAVNGAEPTEAAVETANDSARFRRKPIHFRRQKPVSLCGRKSSSAAIHVRPRRANAVPSPIAATTP